MSEPTDTYDARALADAQARELAALREERAHLHRVAEAARQLCLSITSCQFYPTSRKWQANGRENSLPQLQQAVREWGEWARERQQEGGS